MRITCPYSRCLVFRLPRQPTGCAQVIVTCFFGSFIRPFVECVRWLHLLIGAGTADWMVIAGTGRANAWFHTWGGRRKPFGGLLKANADLYNLHLGAVITL